MNRIELRWHPYRYYPYERDLAIREVQALLDPKSFAEVQQGLILEKPSKMHSAERLVYFAEVRNGKSGLPTLQSKLERLNGNGTKRQSTRYSSHGLHEYKGKFNPQVVRAILNILKVPLGARVLDPFCGSGTALVECSHLGMKAIGTDLNPLAVFIANAKLSALQLPVPRLKRALVDTLRREKFVKISPASMEDKRGSYLKRWFDREPLEQIEKLRVAIERGETDCAIILLSIASNLLRDYSLQDPHDLRIRRRKTPIPKAPFIDVFEQAACLFFSKLDEVQRTLPKAPGHGKAILIDTRTMQLCRDGLGAAKFDCVLTSPPYATALPYIDTQRLSLVWLGLLQPDEILNLEGYLVGSREIRGEKKNVLLSALGENRYSLPEEQVYYCLMLQSTLSKEDGFRRQAMPKLLYRYFADMARAFKSIRGCVRDGAQFALIVGSNHTVLGGQRFDIDTSHHLAKIAASMGWMHEETVPLQTYQRYGYHMNNAVTAERLVILRAA